METAWEVLTQHNTTEEEEGGLSAGERVELLLAVLHGCHEAHLHRFIGRHPPPTAYLLCRPPTYHLPAL